MNKQLKIYDLIETFVSKIDLPIRIVDDKNKIIWMNDALAGMLHIDANDSIGKSEKEILAPAHAQISIALRIESFKLMTHLRSIEIHSSVAGKDIIFNETAYPLELGHTSKIAVTFSKDLTFMRKMEQSSIEGRKHKAAVLSKLPMIFYILDSKGVFVLSEGAGLTTLGLNPGELEGQSVFELYKDNPDILKTLRSALNGELDHSVTTLGGIWFETWYTPLRDESGKITQILCASIDISSRQASEEALKESEQRYRILYQNTYDAIIGVDASGRVRTCNNRAQSLFGYSEAEFIGQSALIIVPDELRDEQFRMHAELHKSGFIESFETVRRIRDGSLIPVEISVNEVKDDEGSRIGSVAVIRDISESKRTQNLLHKQNETIRAILETSKDWIWSVDLEGHYTYSNPVVEQILGYSMDEILNSNGFEFLDPTDRRMIENSLPLWVSKKEGWSNLVTHWRCKDGSYRTLESNAVPVLDTEGAMIGFQGVDRDITERMEAEKALLQSEHRFKVLAEATFEGVVIHRDGIIIDSNIQFQELSGFTADELKGKSIIDLLEPSERERLKPRLKSLLPEPGEALACKNDGSVIPIKFQARALQYEGDEVRVTVVRDVTEEKRAEAEILKANEHLKKTTLELKELKEKIEAENLYLREEVRLKTVHKNIIGQSDSMKSVLIQAEQVAATDSTVLILGETGTGKELLAHAIHEMSTRKDKSLIVVNCAAMPATLVESELFGREKGAYTGAITRQIGRFEIADGGTVFLDEIGELPLETQSKLLRVLQEGQFERLGSSKTIQVDVRILAATNRKLEEEVQQKRFREDLYYRLNVFPLYLPALRERTEDIQPLVWPFIDQLSEKMGKRIDRLSAPSATLLKTYSWPGNIRELRNVVERAMIKLVGNTLKIELPEQFQDTASTHQKIEDVERDHLSKILRDVNWKVSGQGGAAEILGLKPSTLESRMKRLGIQRPK